jgi:hypothetical protein
MDDPRLSTDLDRVLARRVPLRRRVLTVASDPAVVFSVPVRLGWAIFAPSGEPLGSYSYPTPETLEVAMSPQPDGSWQILDYDLGGDVDSPTGQVAGLECQIGLQLLRLLVPDTGQPVLAVGQATLPPDAPARVMKGCIFQVLSSSGGARYLFRFGALLAANPAAHQLTPTLPLASPAEIAAAGAGTDDKA